MNTEKTYNFKNFNNQQVEIKFVRIPSDEKIEKMECSCCGAQLRKAMIINGQVFGYDCGAQKAGRTTYFSRDFLKYMKRITVQ
jgi:hypothetical protein